MQLKSYVAVVVCLVLLSVGSSTADETTAGIGVIVGSVAQLNLPIKTGDYLIEPYAIYYNRDINRPDASSTYTNDDRSVWEAGAGLFRFWPIGSNSPLYQYMGLRLGYFSAREQSRFVNSDSSTVTIRKMETRGYLLAPTIGLEYFASQSASVSTELALRYESETGDMTINEAKYSGVDETYLYGRATVVFRYYFN